MGLNTALKEEPVASLRLLAPIKVSPDTSLRTTIQKMRKRKIGCVVVVDDTDHPVGQFSERGLIKLLAAGGANLDDPVSQHMAGSWTCVKADAPVLDALESMQAHGIRFLIVVDDNGKVLGITGQKGLMIFVADYFPRAVKVQDLEPRFAIEQREGG